MINNQIFIYNIIPNKYPYAQVMHSPFWLLLVLQWYVWNESVKQVLGVSDKDKMVSVIYSHCPFL